MHPTLIQVPPRCPGSNSATRAPSYARHLRRRPGAHPAAEHREVVALHGSYIASGADTPIRSRLRARVRRAASAEREPGAQPLRRRRLQHRTVAVEDVEVRRQLVRVRHDPVRRAHVRGRRDDAGEARPAGAPAPLGSARPAPRGRSGDAATTSLRAGILGRARRIDGDPGVARTARRTPGSCSPARSPARRRSRSAGRASAAPGSSAPRRRRSPRPRRPGSMTSPRRFEILRCSPPSPIVHHLVQRHVDPLGVVAEHRRRRPAGAPCSRGGRRRARTAPVVAALELVE